MSWTRPKKVKECDSSSSQAKSPGTGSLRLWMESVFEGNEGREREGRRAKEADERDNRPSSPASQPLWDAPRVALGRVEGGLQQRPSTFGWPRAH